MKDLLNCSCSVSPLEIYHRKSANALADQSWRNHIYIYACPFMIIKLKSNHRHSREMNDHDKAGPAIKMTTVRRRVQGRMKTHAGRSASGRSVAISFVRCVSLNELWASVPALTRLAVDVKLTCAQITSVHCYGTLSALQDILDDTGNPQTLRSC